VTEEQGVRPGGVWLLTGAQGAGKSTTANLLAHGFERGVRWAVRGWVHVGEPGQAEEARRLLTLRDRLSASVADEHAAAGFPRGRPSVAVVAARHDERRRATGKNAYWTGYTPVENDADVARTPRDVGLWLDTSAQTPEETLAELVARQAEAVVL
jgi:hypothetical protein